MPHPIGELLAPIRMLAKITIRIDQKTVLTQFFLPFVSGRVIH